jgi:hypothetical protein
MSFLSENVEGIWYTWQQIAELEIKRQHIEKYDATLARGIARKIQRRTLVLATLIAKDQAQQGKDD